jgi:hypothetical protein
MAAKCLAIARSGSRCNSPALRGSTFCWLHDPNVADARLEASRKGGRARANSERARKLLPATLTPEELGQHLSKALVDVLDGTLSPKIGTCAATIARALIDIRAAGEIEERLRTLEERAGLSERTA